MNSQKDSLIETVGVIIGLAGLTCLLVGTVAFPVAGTWKNMVSIVTLPVGLIFLVGSAFLKARLAAVLLFPAGIVGIAIGLLTMGKLAKDVPTTPYWAPVIIGAVLIVFSLIVNIPAMTRGAAKRRGLVGANVFVLCLMGLIVLVAANYMASLWYTKRDLTKSGKFTLADKTKEILKTLPEPVEVTFVASSSEVPDPMLAMAIDFAKPMLEDYAKLSKGKLSVRYIDPVTDREDAIKFFTDVKASEKAWSVNFKTSHGFQQVQIMNLLEEPNPMAMYYGAPDDRKFIGETAFTSALIKVTENTKSIIYVTTGKGELSLDPGEQSMSFMKKRLEEDNFELRPINIASEKRIPDDCEILAILGPKRAFTQIELDLISDYLRNQGKLLVALDPVIDRDAQPTGLEKLLEEWGIRARTDIIAFNVEQTLFGLMGSIDVYAQHPRNEITESMKSLSTRFVVCSMMEPVRLPPGPQGQPAPSRWDVAKLAETSDKGWGETEFKGKQTKYEPGADISGPVPLAVCSQERDPNMPPPSPYGPPPKPDPNFNGARIVAIGDSDFLSDEVVRSGPGNIDFTLNSVNWLAKKISRLGISAKPLVAEAVTIEPKYLNIIFYCTLFGLPYLALVVGGIVYWRRSR